LTVPEDGREFSRHDEAIRPDAGKRAKQVPCSQSIYFKNHSGYNYGFCQPCLSIVFICLLKVLI
jgi:hypothetical protein